MDPPPRRVDSSGLQRVSLPASPQRVISSARALPGTIWVLGFGSLLMDTSSELIHSLLPVLMASVLGTPIVMIGVVEGTAEAATSVMRFFPVHSATA